MPRYRIRTLPSQFFAGERTHAAPGRGLEFYEMRGYVPGDEPRFVDWRAYGRTGRLYTKVFQAETQARFRFFVDGSASMQLFGKEDYAKKIFQLLATASKADGVSKPPLWKPQASPSLLLKVAPKGTTVLITDGLDELNWSLLLQKLRKVVLVQILAPEELQPGFSEALLEDVETGKNLEVGPAEIAAYQTALQSHLLRLRTTARRLGSYALVRVGEPILPALVRQGVLEES
jgi:hypothetical protein